MNFFGGFALASPAVLILAPAAVAALVYAYRRYGRGLRQPVGTVLLLKALERTASARQKFKPPPRFFLELLLLLLLLLGAAGLYRRDNGDRVLIVIDNSLSMGVLPAGARESVLDRAKSLAQSTVDALASDTQVAVVTTGQPSAGPLTTIDAAYDTIGTIEVAYAPDSLERLLARVGSDPRYDRIVAFTDRRAQYLAPESRSRIEVQSLLDQTLSNIAVSDIALQSSPSGTHTIRAMIASYCDRSVDVGVVLEGVDLLGGISVLKRETIKLPSRETRPVEFPGITLKSSAFRVSIVPPLGNGSNINALLFDDEGWVNAAPPAEAITVVSDLSIEALGLNRLRHLRFELVKPSEWSAERHGASSTSIFHRFTPPAAPNGNSLFILPPPGGLFDVASSVNDVAVTRWNDADPLASYLNLPALTFKTVSPLNLPPWGREAIATTGGTAAFTGNFEGNRVIVTGFEIFPYEGSKNRILSVLTLNALSWLAATNIGFEPTGTTIAVTPNLERVRHISGDILWQKGDSSSTPLVVHRPGLVALRSTATPEVGRVFNFFDERESNTLNQAPLTVERLSIGERDSETERRYLTPVIALLAALLLLLDLLIFSERGAEPRSRPVRGGA